MKRIAIGLTTLALAAATVVVTGSGAGAETAELDAAKATRFALHGSGFGSRIIGGDVPADSSTTAYQVLGCTNRSGKSTGNHITRATLPGVGTAHEVTSRSWTTARHGVVASQAESSIARLVLRDPAAGRLVLRGLESFTRAFHDGGYDTYTRTRIGSITYIDALGNVLELPAPTPDHPVVTPMAIISVGSVSTRKTASMAQAVAAPVDIEMIPSGTKLRVAKSRARIASGIKRGLFRGQAASVQGSGLAGLLSLGRQALTVMPCQGTKGKLHAKSTASAGLGPVVLNGLNARQKSDQTRRVAFGFEASRIALVTINGGEITAEKIIGRTAAVRTGDGLRRSTKGTEVGEVTVEGEAQEFPDNDVIHIPGVVRLQREIVERHPSGISVTALRIQLLDGSGLVLNLGNSMMKIRDSGR